MDWVVETKQVINHINPIKQKIANLEPKKMAWVTLIVKVLSSRTDFKIV